MSRRKLERLLNLTMCLLATPRFLSVTEIGRLVDGYDPGESPEEQIAFRRMFERDKDELRELGIPVETGSNVGWEDEPGYRIRRGDYALPDIALDPEEAAALGLAARLWSSASLADATERAVRKLAAGGAETLPGPDGLEPRVEATEPAFEPCLAAVQAGRSIRFPYRRAGDWDPTDRHVDPWGVVSWRGHWYLVGHDRDRDAPRVFRLSRVAGSLQVVGPAGQVISPPAVDLREMVAAAEPTGRLQTARLCARPGAGNSLRRTARAVHPAADGDLLEVPYADLERLADSVASYGPDVVVLEPPELRAAVVGRLRATIAAHAR